MKREQMGPSNGAAIRAIRKSKRVTVVHLAEQIGLHEQSLRNIENGNRPASRMAILSLARALNVPVDAITRSAAAEDIPEDDTGPEAAQAA